MATLDWNEAVAAGKTPAEINAFIAARQKAGEAIEVVNRPAARPTMPSLGVNPLAMAAEQAMRFFGERPEQLPEIMAAPGGFAPGPVGALVSGVGGATGEVLRQAITGGRPDPYRTGRVFATQAALGLAGGGLAKPVRAMGERTLTSAVSPVSKKSQGILRQALSRKAGRRLLPGEVTFGKAMAEHHINVSDPAVKELTGQIDALVHEAEALADQGALAGHSFTVDDFSGPLNNLRKKLGKAFNAEPKLRQFDTILERFRAQNSSAPRPAGKILTQAGRPAIPARPGKPLKLTPRQLLILSREWDETARTIYEKAGASSDDVIEKRMALASARGAREALKSMPNIGPRLSAARQEASELIPVQEQVSEAMARGGAANIPFMPSFLQEMLMPRGIRTRTAVSNVGLAMTNPLTQGMVSNLPRAVGAAIGTPEWVESTASPAVRAWWEEMVRRGVLPPGFMPPDSTGR